MNKDKLIIEIKKLERRLQINKKWSLSYVVEYTHQEGWGYSYDITSICDLKLNNNYKENFVFGFLVNLLNVIRIPRQ